MKKIWATLPADIKQTACSILISICLISGSLFTLSLYSNSMRKDGDSINAMAPIEESSDILHPESSP